MSILSSHSLVAYAPKPIACLCPVDQALETSTQSSISSFPVSVIIATFLLPILCLSIYAAILLGRRFRRRKTKASIFYSFELEESKQKAYEQQLTHIGKKANGWLYLIVFFTAMFVGFGLWAVIFPLLCFANVGNSGFISFCSVFATISSAISLFFNPRQKAELCSNVWKETSAAIIDFQIRSPGFTKEAELIDELKNCKTR